MSSTELPFEHLTSVQAVRTRGASRLLAAMLLILFVVMAGALVVTPWQQTAAGKGRVIAYAPLDRQQALEAPLEGRVTRWYVQEGSRVRRGDAIAEVTDNDPDLIARMQEERRALVSRLEAANARARALTARATALSQSREGAVSAADARVTMAHDRVRAAGEAVKVAEAGLVAARLNRERQGALAAKGLAARRAVEMAELDFSRAQTEQARAVAAQSAARAELTALAADKARAGTDATASVEDAAASRAAAEAEAANVRAELARIDVRLSRQAAQRVIAPRDGVILRLLVGQDSEMVKAGEPLALLVPHTTTPAVELWVKGVDVPLVDAGRPVRLQFEGWPAIQVAGWPAMAVGTFGGKVALVDATDDGTGQFRVLVVPDDQEPWPTSRFLRQGVRVNGWVLLNQVPLGYELWRQFNGFPPDVPESDTQGAEQPPKTDAPAKRLKP